jgi:hypothetical protein
MSSRVREWIEDWTQNNVHFDGYPSEDAPDPGATMLAEQCVIQAREDGITEEELEEEAGDLPMYIHQVMKRAANSKEILQGSKSN